MEAPTSLQYMTKFTDLEEERKVREYEFFSGISPKLSYGGFCLHLKRISTPYLLNYYLPSALFVCVSWTSYTIPVDAIPGRIALIVTTFLSLVNIANSAFETSPQNQGINLMQVPINYFLSLKHILFWTCSLLRKIWIISCIGLVMVAVVEYFVLLWLERFGRHRDSNKREGAKTKAKKQGETRRMKRRSDAVDRMFLWASPVISGLFCSVYWAHVNSV